MDVTMSDAIEAAVLVPLSRTDSGATTVTLIRRVDRGTHAGEIGLPGGKREAADPSLRATAIRETCEEIGVAAADIRVLERLPPVHTRTTGFLIQPFLACVHRRQPWSPQLAEVAEIIELDLRDLARPQARTREWIDLPGGVEPIAADCFRIGEVRIWGATYRILDPLMRRFNREGPEVWPPG